MPLVHARGDAAASDAEDPGEKPAARLRRRYKDRGELTSAAKRRLVFSAQARKERQHRRDRKHLMLYEKQRADMRKNMGLNPVLG